MISPQRKSKYSNWRKTSQTITYCKGFILLGDVYLSQGNLFQAKATLESVIENHDGEVLKQLAIDKKQRLKHWKHSKTKHKKNLK